MIQEILDIRPHPFYDEAVKYRNNEFLFIEFIKEFMNNFENNYKQCKDWTNECNEKLMNLVNNTNSFLDLLQSGNLSISNKINKNIPKKLL